MSIEQGTPLVNKSKLLFFFADHIGDIIKKLGPNKAYEHDMISIWNYVEIPYGNHWKSFLKTA